MFFYGATYQKSQSAVVVVCSQREFEITFVVLSVRKSLKAAVKSNESHQQDVSYCYSLDQSQFSWIINMQACFPSVLKVLLNPDSTDFVVLLQLMRLLWADSEIVGGTVAQISGVFLATSCYYRMSPVLQFITSQHYRRHH